jgi:predicted nucleotidyltransferase
MIKDQTLDSHRLIIFESWIGSHLYGTSTAHSDEDFQGVFIPSEQDLLGLRRAPLEISSGKKQSIGSRNQAGDMDRKHYSIQRFIELAAEGQPAMLEMLFVPASLVVTSTPQWEDVLACREAFLSQQSIRPFLGFAQAQANRATLKGKNLQLVQALIEVLSPRVAEQSRIVVSELLDIEANSILEAQRNLGHSVKAKLGDVPVDYLFNERNYPQIDIAGRRFDPGILAKSLLDSLRTLEERYGNRVRKAADAGYDFKSLSHACRLIGEAEELLSTGRITLPRPDATLLLQIKQGLIDRDWFDFLTTEIARIDQDILTKSPLPKTPDMEKLESLCINLQRQQIARGNHGLS